MGPQLFIIFIYDLCYLKLNSNITIFADDSTLYLADTNIRKITENLESDLEKISKWLQHNRLLLNVNKTNAIIFEWKWARKEDLLNTYIDVCNDFEIMTTALQCIFIFQIGSIMIE